jgi:hypothetical protein
LHTTPTGEAAPSAPVVAVALAVATQASSAMRASATVNLLFNFLPPSDDVYARDEDLGLAPPALRVAGCLADYGQVLAHV